MKTHHDNLGVSIPITYYLIPTTQYRFIDETVYWARSLENIIRSVILRHAFYASSHSQYIEYNEICGMSE